MSEKSNQLKLLEIIDIESVQDWPPVVFMLNGDSGFFGNNQHRDIMARDYPYEVIHGQKYFKEVDVLRFVEMVDKIRRGEI